MKVSIIVCTYSARFYPYLEKAVDSLLRQDYSNIQVIIVVDGSPELYGKIKGKMPVWSGYTPYRDIRVFGHKKNRGLSYSRNKGIRKASGDIIVFFDDDAVADDAWISTLVDTYRKEKAIAVGGKILPIWEAERPGFLPDECFWLLGVTHKGFPEGPQEVRNTFGSNISFRRQVFSKIGLFNIKLGRRGERQLQGEETEFSMRMRKRLGKGVYYNPEAVVYHHVFENRVNMVTLLKRSFEQGRSKGILSRIVRKKKYDMDSENDYLNYIVEKALPGRLAERKNNGIPQFLFMAMCVWLVGLGYLTYKMCR